MQMNSVPTAVVPKQLPASLNPMPGLLLAASKDTTWKSADTPSRVTTAAANAGIAGSLNSASLNGSHNRNSNTTTNITNTNTTYVVNLHGGGGEPRNFPSPQYLPVTPPLPPAIEVVPRGSPRELELYASQSMQVQPPRVPVAAVGGWGVGGSADDGDVAGVSVSANTPVSPLPPPPPPPGVVHEQNWGTSFAIGQNGMGRNAKGGTMPS
jgi:hypothetical protein